MTALQILNIHEGDSDKQFSLQEDALASVLLAPDVVDKKVVLVSVAGAFRQGKSFLLDFFLRFMSANGNSEWLGDHTSPLLGFPWRCGAERDTTGILIWSKPFLTKLPNGEEVAVLFMDTQGSFDSTSTVRQCATFFALSTMLSSTQVYNIHGRIQEDHLQHLHLFTEYGRLAMESNSAGAPFQDLVFLVRDWSCPYDYPYGLEGGNKLLESRLQLQSTHHTEHLAVRRHIRSCFSRVSCFLLPYPGNKVATNPKFDGRIADIDSEFVEHLCDLVPSILSPSNLKVKTINGEKITCRELMSYFKAYVEIYQGSTLPEPLSVLEATAKTNNLNAIMTSQDMYTAEMNKICGPDKPYINPNDVDAAHTRIFNLAIEKFRSTRKMGGESFSQEYLVRLEESLEQLANEYRVANKNKNIFQTFRTPAVLAVVLLIFHLISGVSEFLGLSMMTNMVMLPFYMALVSLFTWLFLSYTGQAPELAQAIDSGAQTVMDKVLTPAVNRIGKPGIQRALGIQLPTETPNANTS